MTKNRLLLVVVLCAVVLILGIGFFYLGGLANRGMGLVKDTIPGRDVAKDGTSLQRQVSEQPNLAQLEEPVNILVLGIDKVGPDDGAIRSKPWRSDVIILARVEPHARLVNLLSIPRDTRVRIPGRGMEKINHAYAYGEVPLTIEVVEELLDIKVDHFICIDYATFARMVDIMGGVEINVTGDFRSGVYDFQPGRQVINGRQIYNYISDRTEPRGDIDRIDRQQIFLRALLENIKNKAGVMDLAKMYLEFQKSTETSLTLRDTVKLGLFVRYLSMENYVMRVLPGWPDYIDNISYLDSKRK